MKSSHKESYFIKLLIGFSSIIASIVIIFYAIFELSKDSDWYFWAIVAAFLMCGGIYFCLYAFVHKIKSEFSRRQKQREEQKALSGNV
jgi:protein-S-isoprenylcysteine O-methyltransferase Ste14